MALDPQMKILLVEDAGTMRKMEARILGQVGFTNIVEAVDGNDAMDKLGAEGDIALVISDWSMPNCDGYQLLQWMRGQEAFKNLPFLMATGHGDKAYVAKAKEAGANGVVAKPFTPDELKVLIEEAFGLKQAAAPKKEEGPRISAEGKVHLKMAHIQITDHLALGVLKHQVASGQKAPKHFSLDTLCMPGWNPVQTALENGEVDGAFILAPMAMDLFSYGVPIKLVLFAHRNGSICVRNKTGKYVKPYQQFFKHKTFYIPHKMSIHNMLAHMYFTQMGLRPGVAGKEAVNVLFDVVPPVAMPEFLKENPRSQRFSGGRAHRLAGHYRRHCRAPVPLQRGLAGPPLLRRGFPGGDPQQIPRGGAGIHHHAGGSPASISGIMLTRRRRSPWPFSTRRKRSASNPPCSATCSPTPRASPRTTSIRSRKIWRPSRTT